MSTSKEALPVWRRPISWLALVGLLVLAGLLVFPQVGSSEEAAEDEEAAEPSALSVDAVVVNGSAIADRVRTTGTLRAMESVELTVETPGRITTLALREGNHVEAGELLLSVNNDELQAEKRRLTAQLTLAEANETRTARLLDEGGVSQETYDQAQNEVEVLRADLDQVEARIAKTQVQAPFSGRLGLRYVSEGSYITPDTRIATLQRLDPINIDFSVPERYAGLVETGQQIVFSVRNSDTDYEAEVVAIEPRVTDETRALRVRARASNSDQRLQPGSFADVSLQLGELEDQIVVPNFAVVPDLGVNRVFLYKEGRAQPQEVAIGIRTPREIQITDGLAPGDTVITSGIQQLRPGLDVRVELVQEIEEALDDMADDIPDETAPADNGMDGNGGGPDQGSPSAAE